MLVPRLETFLDNSHLLLPASNLSLPSDQHLLGPLCEHRQMITGSIAEHADGCPAMSATTARPIRGACGVAVRLPDLPLGSVTGTRPYVRLAMSEPGQQLASGLGRKPRAATSSGPSRGPTTGHEESISAADDKHPLDYGGF